MGRCLEKSVDSELFELSVLTVSHPTLVFNAKQKNVSVSRKFTV